jgi:hypothetical protein
MIENSYHVANCREKKRQRGSNKLLGSDICDIWVTQYGDHRNTLKDSKKTKDDSQSDFSHVQDFYFAFDFSSVKTSSMIQGFAGTNVLDTRASTQGLEGDWQLHRRRNCLVTSFLSLCHDTGWATTGSLHECQSSKRLKKSCFLHWSTWVKPYHPKETSCFSFLFFFWQENRESANTEPAVNDLPAFYASVWSCCRWHQIDEHSPRRKGWVRAFNSSQNRLRLIMTAIYIGTIKWPRDH